jgi:predicted anti-sigma-YlaC factor YlaD
MKCNHVRELMPDLAAGVNPATPEVNEHLRACRECAGKLEEFRRTMALLDEWRAPEPSTYFDVRLQARLREEQVKPATGWLQWFRRPALAVSFAVLMAASVTLIRTDGRRNDINTPERVAIDAKPGTAVGDLLALEKNDELYSDFDVLDDLQVQQDVTANP